MTKYYKYHKQSIEKKGIKRLIGTNSSRLKHTLTLFKQLSRLYREI